jgi:hypothetical protein
MQRVAARVLDFCDFAERLLNDSPLDVRHELCTRGPQRQQKAESDH